jgi:N-acetylmuramoyl-L-alanine amidase
MRVKGATIQNLLLGLALLAGLLWNLAHASEIKDLRVSAGATGTRAEIRLDREAEFSVLSLSNPDRLVIDLPGSTFGRGVALPDGGGLVRAVRNGQPVPGTTRIVFDLAGAVVALKPRFELGVDGPRLVVEWPGDGTGSAAAVAATTVPASSGTPAGMTAASVDPVVTSAEATSRLIAELARNGAVASAASSPASPQPQTASDPSRPVPESRLPEVHQGIGTIATGVPTRIATGEAAATTTPPRSANAPVRTMRDVMGRGMRPLVVAIDAGHGGQDPGAVGPNGKREKDVTLAVARELARQVNATPGLKAYLTRDSDVFIPLNRRAVLARNAKADIFLSIHADAAENRSARGASVYVLSLRGASSQRARWLADKENAADLIGGVKLSSTSNTLASVLLDLTQSGQMKASEDVAGHVLDSLGRVGHKRRVERANFAVLRTSDMPAMLVETGFISNPEEEGLLTRPDYQRKVAAAVLEGVNAYFTRQPPPGTLYAARANAGGASLGGGGSP